MAGILGEQGGGLAGNVSVAINVWVLVWEAATAQRLSFGMTVCHESSGSNGNPPQGDRKSPHGNAKAPQRPQRQQRQQSGPQLDLVNQKSIQTIIKGCKQRFTLAYVYFD